MILDNSILTSKFVTVEPEKLIVLFLDATVHPRRENQKRRSP